MSPRSWPWWLKDTYCVPRIETGVEGTESSVGALEVRDTSRRASGDVESAVGYARPELTGKAQPTEASWTETGVHTELRALKETEEQEPES